MAQMQKNTRLKNRFRVSELIWCLILITNQIPQQLLHVVHLSIQSVCETCR